MRYLLIFLACLLPAVTVIGDTVEAGNSCVVVHVDELAGDDMTCFENIALERTSFESGVCQWKTDEQADENVETKTRFVPYCPASYSAFCDRLVLGQGIVVPVKIFLYDDSGAVLARAEKQCRMGGGKWTLGREATR